MEIGTQPAFNPSTCAAIAVASLLFLFPQSSSSQLVAGPHNSSDYKSANTATEISPTRICLDLADAQAGYPVVHYTKGNVRLRQGDRDQNVSPLEIARQVLPGDTLITDKAGFVSVRYANGAFRNVQPNSVVSFFRATRCSPTNQKNPEVDTSYLIAAIRG